MLSEYFIGQYKAVRVDGHHMGEGEWNQLYLMPQDIHGSLMELSPGSIAVGGDVVDLSQAGSVIHDADKSIGSVFGVHILMKNIAVCTDQDGFIFQNSVQVCSVAKLRRTPLMPLKEVQGFIMVTGNPSFFQASRYASSAFCFWIP